MRFRGVSFRCQELLVLGSIRWSSTTPNRSLHEHSSDAAEELQREEKLRNDVLHGMPESVRKQMGKYDHSTYANHQPLDSSNGGNMWNAVSNAAMDLGTTSSSTSSGSKQQRNWSFPSFLPPTGEGSISTTMVGGVDDHRRASDILMFLSGLLVLLYSVRCLLHKRSQSNSSSNVVVLLAVASVEQQAHNVLFITCFPDAAQREALHYEFDAQRNLVPMNSFFDWLSVRYPQWGCSSSRPRAEALQQVASALQGTGTAPFATAISISRSFSNPNSALRVDHLLEQLSKGTSLVNAGWLWSSSAAPRTTTSLPTQPLSSFSYPSTTVSPHLQTNNATHENASLPMANYNRQQQLYPTNTVNYPATVQVTMNDVLQDAAAFGQIRQQVHGTSFPLMDPLKR